MVFSALALEWFSTAIQDGSDWGLCRLLRLASLPALIPHFAAYRTTPRTPGTMHGYPRQTHSRAGPGSGANDLCIYSV